MAEPHRFATIHAALAQPVSRHFGLACENGISLAYDPVSFYAASLDDPDLTFDISNNAALACVWPIGAIRNLVFYRGNARVDSSFPGMWVSKLFSSEGPYAFKVRLNGQPLDLAHVDWPYRTSLLDNVLPVTELRGEQAKITLLTFAPISADGAWRLRAVIYGTLITNLTAETLEATVSLPMMESKVQFHLDDENSYMVFVDRPRKDGEAREVTLSLAPGESAWVPVVISAPGETAVEEVEERGSLYWLNETLAYYRNLTGNLRMPGDPFAAEYFERAVHQSLMCIGVDQKGLLAGSDLGTSPTTEIICMKDLYYSCLPLCWLEPDFMKRAILWFLEHNVRPPGNKFGAGGVRHSLGNALTPILLTNFYYEATGDWEFLLAPEHDLRRRLDAILEQVLGTRLETGPWLFPSRFISDGPSMGDYHAGSNVCAWYAFSTFARMLREVYGEPEMAARYAEVAQRIREAIDSLITIDGPHGRHYNEGVNADGSLPVLGHEGEENDTTLMPVYCYRDYDDPLYRASMRFAITEANEFYSPRLKGIRFGTDGALTSGTFPGYVTGFANVVDAASMSGPDGFLTEIRRHTDVDGSPWWWPYLRQGTYSEVVRISPEIPCYPGKCGWGAGVFAALFIDQILGLRYDAPAATLRFRPFSPSSDFTWDGFRLGSGRFSAHLARRAGEMEVGVTNENAHDVLLSLEVPVPTGAEIASVETNGRGDAPIWVLGHFLNMPAIRMSHRLLPGEARRVVIQLK